jgi:hypothetical protein
MYVEKFHILNRTLKDLRYKNKTMEKELSELKKELNKETISYNNDDIIIQINENYVRQDEILDLHDDGDFCENEDKYELV